MTARNRAKMVVEFDGAEPIQSVVSFTLKQTWHKPTEDTLQFTVNNVPRDKREEYISKTAKGERVTVSLDGARQATMVIMEQSGKVGGDSGFQLDVTAKSMLAAAHRGAVDPYYAKELKADTPLREVILEALFPYGFDSVVLDTEADVTAISGKSLTGRADPAPLDELKLKNVASQHGQSAYQFVAKLCTRYGYALRTNNEGLLILGAPDYDQAAAYTVEQDRLSGHGGNLMIAPSWHASNEGVFSHYVSMGEGDDQRGATSAGAPAAGLSVPGAPELFESLSHVPLETIETGRHHYSSTAQPFKPKIWKDKQVRDRDQCRRFARAMAHGQVRGFQVRHSVDGVIAHTDRIWTVDTVGRVIFGELGLDENMWLLETAKSQSRNGGQSTQLTWVPLYALDLRAT